MEISQKAEDLLILSMDATTQELEESDVLSAGIEADGRWEIIIKYHGDILQFEDREIRIEPLQFGYAIVTLPEERIEEFLLHEQVEYAEKPKELYEQDLMGNLAACMENSLTGREDGSLLTGEGVCIALIDSGLDVMLPCFQNEDGSSRVLFYYDQTTKTEYSQEDINAYIRQQKEAGGMPTQNSIIWDETGHGTRVASIAAGNGRREDGSVSPELMGAAPKAWLIAVRLDTKNKRSFPLTTSVMRAFDYVQRKCIALNLPMAVNLSFGNSYGPHDGTSILEGFINEVAQTGKMVICVGAGNEGAAGGHTGGRFMLTENRKSIFFQMGYYQRSSNLQLWFLAVDQYNIRLISPNGETIRFETDNVRGKTVRTTLQNTDILLYIGTAQPYTMKREIFFSFTGNPEVNPGTWELELEKVSIKSGNYNLYLPSSLARSRDTVFLQPTPELTITIPATAQRVISVGAYNMNYRAYAEFSGRGFVAKAVDHNLFFVKPELVASGVSVLTQTESGPERVNGTSFATPFVTGAAARLLQEGIVMGKDPYMYGEKCKAYLAKRAQRLPEDDIDINEKTGYGALCLRNPE
ncbi:MAG: S8 family serine peptidase [Lachnospiraceae bacterium]|nr:S8 family serine peptidase [Lachnospiraceae bacterium]